MKLASNRVFRFDGEQYELQEWANLNEGRYNHSSVTLGD